jgi:hypothetical protein
MVGGVFCHCLFFVSIHVGLPPLVFNILLLFGSYYEVLF